MRSLFLVPLFSAVACTAAAQTKPAPVPSSDPAPEVAAGTAPAPTPSVSRAAAVWLIVLDGPSGRLEADSASDVRQGVTHHQWFRVTFARPQSVAKLAAPVKRTLTNYDIDCMSARLSVHSVIYFDAGARQLLRQDFPDEAWSSPVPGTIGAAVVQWRCTRR